MIIKLLNEHHLEVLSLKGGCTGFSESTIVNHIIGRGVAQIQTRMGSINGDPSQIPTLVFHQRVSAHALVIYVSKLPLGACSIRVCSISKLRKWIRCKLPDSSVFYSSFSDSPSTKLLPKFHHCVSDVDILWILDCF